MTMIHISDDDANREVLLNEYDINRLFRDSKTITVCYKDGSKDVFSYASCAKASEVFAEIDIAIRG